MILTIGNTKGGTGKTTMAINIAIGRAMAGRDVWLIDADRQGSTLAVISIRTEAGISPGVACAQYCDGKTLAGQVKQQAAKYDDVIIDAGGRDSGALRAALVLSDVLLIPFPPRSLDVWALHDMAGLIDEARRIGGGPPTCYAMLSRADAGRASSDNADAAAAAREFSQFEYLDAPITERKAFANASSQGLSVLEMRRKDQKAIAEVNALLSILG